MKRVFFLFFIAMVFGISFSNAQSQTTNLYPTHWWVGMKMNQIQLIIHQKDIGTAKTITMRYPNVVLEKVHKVENKNYLFLDILIKPTAKPGKLPIQIDQQTIYYELKQKAQGSGVSHHKGVTSEDVIYLLMPDRFSNGDPSNDYYNDLRDAGHDRTNPFDRHGGDLLGVQNKLDYLKDLGMTTIWMTPVVENDMTRTMEGGTSRSTYHGYAFTNHYQIDKRFGGNAAYKNLADEAHKKGLKIMQDAVYNHIGNDHWSYKDLPMKDWINQWPVYQNTSYKDQPLSDPYAAEIDKKIVQDGWFTPFLIDINQRNPYVSTFLKQYGVWATQEFGIDGWRVDTYYYSDSKFLNEMNDVLLKEFPKLTVFGESWMQSVPNTAYFTRNTMNVPFKHNCMGSTDFPFLNGIVAMMNEPFGWNEGANKFYQIVAQDYLYAEPMNNCTFLDNHDLDRIHSVLGGDIAKNRMATGLLLTHRGIPQLYYGHEIITKNFKDPTDAEVRKDFPGGWEGDAVNKFIQTGRTAEENEFFNFVKTICNYRKNSNALKKGKLIQYLPKEGVYVFFRLYNNEKVMVVINPTSDKKEFSLDRFIQCTGKARVMKNIVSGKQHTLPEKLEMEGKTILIAELK